VSTLVQALAAVVYLIACAQSLSTVVLTSDQSLSAMAGCLYSSNELFSSLHIWYLCGVVGFFFSSRRRHTRLVSDWSSDVCSSDLDTPGAADSAGRALLGTWESQKPAESAAPGVSSDEVDAFIAELNQAFPALDLRSEERRVGKEGRSRGWQCSWNTKEWWTCQHRS